jgi:hypothetical protein
VNIRFGQVPYVLTDDIVDDILNEYLDDRWSVSLDAEASEQVQPCLLELNPTLPPFVERRDRASAAVHEERSERTWWRTGVGGWLEHLAEPRDVATRRRGLSLRASRQSRTDTGAERGGCNSREKISTVGMHSSEPLFSSLCRRVARAEALPTAERRITT